jgi:hypothetical protein
MEYKRLTDPKQVNCIGLSVCGGGCDTCPSDNKYYRKLSAYEDSGLSPEQVQELANSMPNKEVQIKCASCGKFFPTKRPTQAKYCDECKSTNIACKIHRQKNPEKAREYERNYARKKSAKLKAIREKRGDTP